MVWSGVGGVSCAHAAGITQSSAGNSSTAGKKRTVRINWLLEPLIPMNALRILPRNARGVMQMTRENLRIHFLKIEVTRAVQIFRKLCAAGLKLWNRGEASRSRSFCTIRQNFPKRFRAARADHHVRRYSHNEKIPLRDARAALFPSEGYFEESYVALVAFRSQLIAEERPHQLERFRLLSNPKKVDLFRRVQRRTRLHRCEFSRWQAECIRQRHTEPCGRERVEHVRVTLLSLRKCGLCYPFYDAVNPHEIDLSRAVGHRIRGRKRDGGGRARACRPNVEGRSG